MRECPSCGAITGKLRSGPDHRRFFAIIHAVYQMWPEDHEFQPDSSEHLRAWLTCEAGFRDVTTIMLADNADVSAAQHAILTAAIAGALKAAGAMAFVVPHPPNAAYVVRPKSIAWDKLGQAQFAAVRTAVEEVIFAETGLVAGEVLTEKERAA